MTQRSPPPMIRRTVKRFFVRLNSALVQYVASTAGSFARLWVFQHRVLVVDPVLRFKIVGIGCCPMLIQRRTYLSDLALQNIALSLVDRSFGVSI